MTGQKLVESTMILALESGLSTLSLPAGLRLELLGTFHILSRKALEPAGC